MVFTCAVPENQSNHCDPARLSRRTALFGFGALGLGFAAVSVAGCTSDNPGKTVDQAISSDSLGPLYTETLTLIDAYDQAINASPEIAVPLGQLRDEHRQHALALAGLMGTVKPSISPAPNPSGASVSPSQSVTTPSTSASPQPALASLSTAEKTAQMNAAAASKTTPADRVAVLAAITACRATHVAALGAMR